MYGAHMYLVFVTLRVLMYVYRYVCIRHARSGIGHCKVYFKGGRQLGF